MTNNCKDVSLIKFLRISVLFAFFLRFDLAIYSDKNNMKIERN